MKKNNFNVLFVTGSFPPEVCGIGDYTSLLAGALARTGAGVSVLTSSYLGIKKSKANPAVYPEVKSWKAGNVFSILKRIRELKPDIAHFQYPNTQYRKNLGTNLLPMLIKIFVPGVKVVSTLHEPLKRLKFTGRLRLAINLAFSDAAVFVEEENMKTTGLLIGAALGNRAKKVIEIGSNIPKAVLKGSEKEKIQKQAGLKKGQKLMVTFGFITAAKGFDELIRAFDSKKFRWVHLGRVNESEAFQLEWKQKATEAGVFGQIKFIPGLGPQQIAQWLASADLCVFPFKGGLSPRNGSFSRRCATGYVHSDGKQG